MDEVRAVMDAAGSEKAVLFGTIGGGAMSGLFAATFPERALGLILCGTFGRLEPDTGLLARLAPTQEAAVERIEREWGTEGVCVVLLGAQPRHGRGDEERLPSARPLECQPWFGTGVNADGVRGSTGKRFSPLSACRRSCCTATDDLVVPVHQGRNLAELIPERSYRAPRQRSSDVGRRPATRSCGKWRRSSGRSARGHATAGC